MSMPTATGGSTTATASPRRDRYRAARRERVWRLPLDVAMVNKDVTRTVPRAVVFRLGASGRTLGYAAAGYLEGTVALGDKSGDATGAKARRLAARRADGDGNGLMADAQDRLWIDLNGDGRFDPSAEQFLFATILNLDAVAVHRPFGRAGEPAGRRAAARRRHAAAGLEGRRRLCQRRVRRAARHRPGPRRLGLRPLRLRAGDRSGRRVPAGHGHHRPRRSQGRPALVLHLLGQRCQGRPPVVQGREGRRGRDRPHRDAELRDQPERQCVATGQARRGRQLATVALQR